MNNTQKAIQEMRQFTVCYSLNNAMRFCVIDISERDFIWNYEILIDTSAFFGAFDDMGKELTEEEEDSVRSFAWATLEKAYATVSGSPKK